MPRTPWVQLIAMGLLVAVATAGLATGARADTAKRWSTLSTPVFRNIDADHGLPGAWEPTALVHDHQGVVWIGSQSGVMWWDGYRFHQYVHSDASNTSLPDNNVFSLHVDTRDTLWIGSNSGALARFDRSRDGFISYPVASGAFHPGILAIADDPNGGLWIGREGGLDHFNPNTGKFDAIRFSGDAPRPSVSAILNDSSGRLWVATNAGLFRREQGASTFAEIDLAGGTGKRIATLAIFEDGQRRIWIGSLHLGAFRIDPLSRDVVRVRATDGAGALEGQTVSAISAGAPGEIWIGTAGQGVVRVDSQSLTTQRVRHDAATTASLDNDTVVAIERDPAGLVWVATVAGFGVYNSQQNAFVTIPERVGGKGLGDALIFSLADGRDGKVWVGTGASGAILLDPATALIRRLRPDPRNPASALPESPVTAILPLIEGPVYVGSGSWVYLTDSQGKPPVRVASGPAEGVVKALERQGNILWIGRHGLSGLRLDHWGRPTGERVEIVGSLLDPYVEALTTAADGSLWVGLLSGVNHLDQHGRVIEAISPGLHGGGLSSGAITSLVEDRAGRLWVGSTGGGVDVLDRLDMRGRRRIRHVGIERGLPNANVDRLLLGADGAVWASTDSGLATIDPDTLRVRSFGRPEGMTIGNYMAGAGASTAAGELMFGGLGGVTVVRPADATPWNFVPTLIATQVEVGGRARAGVVASDGVAAPIHVPANANSVKVEFSALDYSAPGLNRYAYQLLGYDRNWISADSDHRVAAYTNLDPGHYRLRLRGSNRSGVWTPDELILPIEVDAAWYQSAWFKVAMVCVGLGSAAALLQARTAYLVRRRRELERQVAERTRELHESQVALEALAYSDALTGLSNRRRFNDEFRRLVGASRRRDSRFTLLLIDLDGFKTTNDTLGHDAGDALLVEIAARLTSVMRVSDHLFRLGGDEFAILLVDVTAVQKIDDLCLRIAEAVGPPVIFRGEAMYTTPSLGVAIYPDHGVTEEQIYKAADLGLYAAKQAGRNTWRMLEPAVETLVVSIAS